MTRPAWTAGTPAAMVRGLAEFFEFLRTRGLAVGIGAQLDLGSALRNVRGFDRDGFRDACRATLAKSLADLEALDAALDAYWAEGPVAAVMNPAPGAVPSRPQVDGRMTSGLTAETPTATTSVVAIPIGVYSPSAPSGGHSLTAVDARRLGAIRAGARAFRRRVATLPGRRFETAHRGRLDFRRTSRHAVQTSGEWIDVRRIRRRPSRAELLVLWDVSGSMRDHDSELAALVYALGRTIRTSRVFAFSTEIRELTHCLAGTPYPRALDALTRGLQPAGGGTKIGRCLADFRRDHGRLVHRRTTVVILSDGWDLGETDLLEREVRWLRSRANRVVWVNPYARSEGFRPETAGMQRALPYVDLVAPEDFETRRAGVSP